MEKYIALLLLGLIFGSFITMLSYRMVHGGSYKGRSKCTMCKKNLKAQDLIPLFSFLWQLGKCRYCKKKISLRYPMVEALSALAFIGLAGYWHDKLLLFVFILMTIGLIVMVVIDFEHMIIPDEIQVFLAAVGLVYAFLTGTPLMQVVLTSLLCLIISLAIKYGFIFFTKKDGLGWGDVKFFAVAGIYLPIELLSAFFLISGLVGVIVAISWRLMNKGKKFPFGPALAFSLYICLIFPEAREINQFFNHV